DNPEVQWRGVARKHLENVNASRRSKRSASASNRRRLPRRQRARSSQRLPKETRSPKTLHWGAKRHLLGASSSPNRPSADLLRKSSPAERRIAAFGDSQPAQALPGRLLGNRLPCRCLSIEPPEHAPQAVAWEARNR